jgi:methylglutaconyl-CoA hydratase
LSLYNQVNNYNTIIVELNEDVAKITLNRVKVRNALNNEMITELIDALRYLSNVSNLRALIITGAGTVFSSGADLNWLLSLKEKSYEENYKDSEKLVELLEFIENFPTPTIAMLNGSAVGGGVGVMLSCDIILSIDTANFSISEVTKGVVPAAIVHLVIERIGTTRAKEYLITGKRINAKEALDIGLINYSLSEEELISKLTEIINTITNNAPVATRKVKEMINKSKHLNNKERKNYISHTIAELRTGKEANDGINKFLGTITSKKQ